MTRRLALILCMQGLLGLHYAHAATYYVSPTGADTNDGISLATPVKTIKKALSKAQLSGDIIYVLTGTYVETVDIRQNGITLSAYPTNKPVIDGTTTLPNVDWGDLIYVAGNNNTIVGFEVKNSNITGRYLGGYGVQVGGHHNKLSRMNVHHAWRKGILINGDYNIVEDSIIWQCARHNIASTAQSGWSSGMSAARNPSSAALKSGITSYTIFRRNRVFNNWGEGLSCYEADHCTIEDNIIYDNWTANLYLSDTPNSLVQRNIIYVSSNPAIPTRNNTHPSLLLADEVSSVPRSANNVIINNFIYNTDLDAFSWSGVSHSGLNNVLIANNTIVDGGLFTGAGGSHAIVNVNSEIRNNIIWGTDNDIPSNVGITFSNNNWHGRPTLAKSSTDVLGDPKIARTGLTTAGKLTADYFKLLPDSPAIDAAMPLNEVPTDFFKKVRGTAPDVGGYEFQ